MPSICDESDDYFEMTPGLIEMIVFTGESLGPHAQVYSIDPEGANPIEQWTNCTDLFVEGAVLSPCGGYILYTGVGLTSWFYCDARIIDVSTGSETDITPAGLDGLHGDFSNDGTNIVIAAGTFGYPLDLYTMNYDGSNVQQLATGVDAWAPQYSPDDTEVIYTNFGTNQVYILDIASGVSTPYTNNGTWNDNPHYSPDGSQIAWATGYGSGTRQIYVSPVSSWTPPDYTINAGTSRSPCFNPDGTKIVFDHGAYSGTELAVYDIAQGTWQDITSNDWGEFQADWGYMIPH